MAAFHLAGMLPVIPGPCGLSRYKDMKGEPWVREFEFPANISDRLFNVEVVFRNSTHPSGGTGYHPR